MQNLGLNLVDLFSAAKALDEEGESVVTLALKTLMEDDASLLKMAEAIEHFPETSEHTLCTFVIAWAVKYHGNSDTTAPGFDLVKEAALLPASARKTQIRPSWDTFSKARPIILSASQGVFM